MTDKIVKLRKDTPGTGHVLHLNNAGSSLMTIRVMDAVRQYQEEEFLKGGYETEFRWRERLNSFYTTAARYLNCSHEEVAFTDSATTAWQRAFFSIPWNHGDEIITGTAEYASNYISFMRLKKWFDIRIKVAEDLPEGETDPDSVEDLIGPKTRLVAITHMPTLNGLINRAEEIGKVTKKHGVLYLLDACQSAGQYPLDVKKLGCDFLSATGRKFVRGPRGTGFLYVRKGTLLASDPMSVDLFSGRWEEDDTYSLRNDGHRFENFELNHALKWGLANALEYEMEVGTQWIRERVDYLAGYTRKALSTTGLVRILDTGSQKSGIICMELKGMSIPALTTWLMERHVNVAYAGVANSRLLMEKTRSIEALRVSVHYYNTEEEIDRFIVLLKEFNVTRKG